MFFLLRHKSWCPIRNIGNSTPAPNGHGTQTAYNVADLLKEGRLIVNVVASVQNAGHTDAIKTGLITLRVWDASPYVTPVDGLGVGQSAQGGTAQTSGDYGGCDPSNPTGSCDTQASQAVGDTRLQPDPTCTADPMTGGCTTATPMPTPYAGVTYQNANNASSGFSR